MGMSKQGQSLVQEAEMAFLQDRLLQHQAGGNNNNTAKKAIEEYTHAIYAITYFASISNGAGLVGEWHLFYVYRDLKRMTTMGLYIAIGEIQVYKSITKAYLLIQSIRLGEARDKLSKVIVVDSIVP
jgi:hypothetical protein